MAAKKLLGVLGVLVVAVGVAGALWSLASGTLVSDRRVAAAAVVAIVAASVAVVSVLGARSRDWLSNPYW